MNPLEEIRPSQEAGERNLDYFAKLFEQHSADAMALAYSKLSNRADAEEVVQNSFLDAYRTLPKLRDPQRFGGWLRSIVLNQCADFVRSKIRRNKLHEEAAKMRPVETPVVDDPQTERMSAVLEALNALPDTYREPLTLRHIRGYSYSKIAQAMSLPLDTVRTRLCRGDAMLKAKLQRLVRRGELS